MNEEQFTMGFDPHHNDKNSTKGSPSIIRKDGEKLVTEYLSQVNNDQKIFDQDLLNQLVHFSNGKFLEEKPKVMVGIDPGKSGGIIAILGHEIIGKWVIPITGDKVDMSALYAIFKELKSNYHLSVILEEVHSIYGTSAESNFVFGFVCGAIEAIVIANNLRLNKVQPKEWQAEIWQNGDKVYKVKKPEQKKAPIDTKATSLNAAKRLFPDFDFRGSDSKRVTKLHDGLIDAACLCEFGRRKNW